MNHLLAVLLLSVASTGYAQEAVAPPAGPAIVAPGTATVLFKSQGDAMDVVFHTSSDPAPCAGLTRTAAVYDAVLLEQKLLPFIAKMQKKTRAMTHVYPSVEVQVKADTALQVLGGSNWAGSGAGVTTFGKCGPFTQQFMPRAGRSYLVLFQFAGNGCSQSVKDTTDATDAVAAVDVETTPLQCTAPSSFFK